MSRYTQLRHAGYYQDGLSDADRKKIAAAVDRGETPNETPAESTVWQEPAATPTPKKSRAKKS